MDPKTTREIIKTSNVLRKKFRSLKRGIEDVQERSQKHFAPVVGPLLDIKQALQKNDQKLEAVEEVKKKKRDSIPKRDWNTPGTMWWDDESYETPSFHRRSTMMPSPISDESITPSIYRRSTMIPSITQGSVDQTPISALESTPVSSLESAPTLEPSTSSSSAAIVKTEPAGEELYETDEPFSETLYEYVRTPQGEAELEENLRTAGSLQREYLEKLLKGSTKSLDSRYGLRVLPNGGLAIGDSSDVQLYTNSNDIAINGKTYEGTPGLLQLLYLKSPKEYTNQDLKNYKDILIATNAHKRGYSDERGIAGSRSEKYKNVIGKLFPPTSLASVPSSSMRRTTLRSFKKGKGLMDTNSPIWEFWDDPNELVDRLRLLVGSSMAGNNAHYNEIQSILEELREANIIY